MKTCCECSKKPTAVHWGEIKFKWSFIAFQWKIDPFSLICSLIIWSSWNASVHRGVLSHFTVWWIYHYHRSKSTGNITGKTHLNAQFLNSLSTSCHLIVAQTFTVNPVSPGFVMWYHITLMICTYPCLRKWV